ncbi:hypothetical protein ACNKHL_18220 [Shigella flexneri]
MFQTAGYRQCGADGRPRNACAFRASISPTGYVTVFSTKEQVQASLETRRKWLIKETLAIPAYRPMAGKFRSTRAFLAASDSDLPSA